MSDPFIGQIMPVGFNFAPRNWAFCEGQLLAISQYTALFSLLGTTFGGDGRTTFGLPDLRGRSAVGEGDGPGLGSIRWGEKGGSESTTLSVANLPAHGHATTIRARNGAADATTPAGNSLAVGEDANRNPMNLYATGAPDVSLNAGSAEVADTGSNQSFTNRSPYLGIHYCICLAGLFPSRS